VQRRHPRNHFYLACDTKDGGLLGFDVTTGRCQMHVVTPFEPGWPERRVIEGLTVLDLDDGPVPRMRGASELPVPGSTAVATLAVQPLRPAAEGAGRGGASID
jgi:hypothetical protein